MEVPMSQLLRGIAPAAFLAQPFVNPASAMFAFDLIVSCVV
jgi:hypothetical protein